MIGKDVTDRHDFHGLAVWVCNSKVHEELVMFLPTDKDGQDVDDCPTCGANVLESYEIFPLYLSDLDPADKVGATIAKRRREVHSLPHVVVTGNPVDGFRFFGPVDHDDISNGAYDNALHGEEWWGAPLETLDKDS